MRRKRKKKNQPKLKGLDADQCAFIENRVRVLGSLAAVKRAYRADDTVSAYALMVALKTYGEGWSVPKIDV